MHITKSIEAQQAALDCQFFKIKMANINSLSLQAEMGGSVGALYTQVTRAVARQGDLAFDLVRGHLQVRHSYICTYKDYLNGFI